MRIDANGTAITAAVGQRLRALLEKEEELRAHHIMLDSRMRDEAHARVPFTQIMKSATWFDGTPTLNLFGLPMYTSEDVPPKSILFFDRDNRLIGAIVNIGISEEAHG